MGNLGDVVLEKDSDRQKRDEKVYVLRKGLHLKEISIQTLDIYISEHSTSLHQLFCSILSLM